MKTLIIGANGKIGKRLAKQLKESEHTPVAMVRKKDQIQTFKNMGIDTVMADLEDDISHAFKDIDAVVFTAGSGASTPKSQTKIIDQDGAIKAVDQAIESGVDRFVMVSALLANRDANKWPEPMQHYYEAKSTADEYLRNSELNHTVLMPGRLTDEEGTGKVELKKRIDDVEGRAITRDDVATVIREILDASNSYRKSLELLQGNTPVEDAIRNL